MNTKLDFSDLVARAEGYTHLLVGSRFGGSDTFALAAIGEIDMVLAPTSGNETREDEGVFWYANDGKGMGFAGTSDVSLNSADTKDGEFAKTRLSWHLTDSGNGYRVVRRVPSPPSPSPHPSHAIASV